MANARNILVGAADIYLTGIGVDGPTAAAAILGGADAIASNKSYSDASAGVGSKTSWRNVGYTTEGLELSYEPDYGEVQVDQLLDSARIFKQGLKVMLNTSFTEGTLEAMQVAFGQDDQVQVAGAAQNALTVASSGSNTTLNLAGGALGTSPVERALVAVGNAPAQFGTTNAASGFGGGTYNPASSAKKERVYVARRVVSMETVSHGLKRNEATVFPVSFRCLPDSTNGASDASEYGKIIDRVYG